MNILTKPSVVLALLLCCLCSAAAEAQPANARSQGVIASDRVVDWTRVGAGTIPTRAICISFSSLATAADINTGFANCPAGQKVHLNAGTYTLSDAAVILSKSNVTLEGAGPNQTFLNLSVSTACGGLTKPVCFQGGSDSNNSNPENVARWTTYPKGTQIIHLGTQTVGSTKPAVGDILVLNQDVDAASRAGDTFPEVFWCLQMVGDCTQQSNGPQDQGPCVASCWGMFQTVLITSISGGVCTDASPCAVGIDPPLHLPNWGLRSTQAWWSSTHSVTGIGLENLAVQGAEGGIGFRFATKSWVKNVRLLNTGGGAPHYIFMGHAVRNTIRDSYLFGYGDGRDEYGLDCTGCSANLFENNILERIRTNFEHQMGNGNVFAYNYVIQNAFSGGSEQGSISNHGTGMAYTLSEGNDGFGLKYEDYFGAANFITSFRDRWWGHTSNDVFGDTGNITPISIQVLSRFANIIGDVLGTVGYHVNYQRVPGDGQDGNYGNKAIFCLGVTDCWDTLVTPDTHFMATLMRWGNWTADTQTVHWDNAEVPTGLSKYKNLVPRTHNLPASLYLRAKPSWFGTVPFPPIGPEVTGGDLANSGGHAYRIPARVCAEDVLGIAFSDTTVKPYAGCLWN